MTNPILIVDDEPTNLATLRQILSTEYALVFARNGNEALAAVAKHNPSLILLDVMMPEMDGYEVCTRLKTAEKTKDIPIIFLTAKSEISDETKGLELGAADYIIKPISPPILFARVKTHLAMKKMQDLLKEKATILEETNDNLIKINTQKDRFLGVVAHDLRNPLTVIQGYCDLLLTESLNADEVVDMLQTMDRSIVQMCNLVADLLDVSQVNLGKFTLQKERIDLASYMYSIVKPNQLLAKRKKITLFLSPIDEKALGYFDPHRIRQVITNLLSNSIKFSDPETTVTLSVECNEANYLIFKVKDQGKGIKEEEIPYVFGEFQKTSTTSTAGEQSTGLGLAICRSIVLAHEGEIKCESVIHQGSCFSFQIPNV
ncbi:MAG: hybrid sensor histidine kinase/response regulator [Methylococcales bacterium]|nr:hybrid sensor histidine kinase/response regulator [Methylococcales bacterium]